MAHLLADGSSKCIAMILYVDIRYHNCLHGPALLNCALDPAERMKGLEN